MFQSIPILGLRHGSRNRHVHRIAPRHLQIETLGANPPNVHAPRADWRCDQPPWTLARQGSEYEPFSQIDLALIVSGIRIQQ